jgi:AraC family transcriptional regulator
LQRRRSPETCPPAPGFRGEVTIRRAVPGFVLTELRHRSPSRNASHEHGRAYFSRLTSGSYRERDAGGEISYSLGSVRFHPAAYRHGDEVGPGGARFLCVEIEEDAFPDISSSKRVPRLAPPASETARLASAISRELRLGGPASDIVLEGFALQMLGEFARLPSEERVPAWLRRVAERLREESARPLRLGELAAGAGVHPVHLARSFRRHYHRSIGEEMRRHRVEAVRAAIARGNVSLCDAAADAGFADQSHMSRVFRRVVGMSPREYRVRFGPKS